MVPSLALAEMRARAPLVQCITNSVAMNYAANAMLAAGASPAMVHSAEESSEFSAKCGALTINIGTLASTALAGMTVAVKSANTAGVPWVFDPVAHFATTFRSGVARDLLALGPTVLRGNASEVLAFTATASHGKGVDAGDPVAAAHDAARKIASDQNMVVAVTGPVDFVTDGARAVAIHGGNPLMPLVTATGCALTCITGAFVAVIDDPFDAAVAALTLFAEAGERAGRAASGPGEFAWKFLDSLHATTPGQIDDGRVALA